MVAEDSNLGERQVVLISGLGKNSIMEHLSMHFKDYHLKKYKSLTSFPLWKLAIHPESLEITTAKDHMVVKELDYGSSMYPMVSHFS